MNILVLCTGNSARSILLESLLNAKGEGRVRAWSAGSHPAGAVHPQSLRLLAAKGHDTAHLRSKSWDEFAVPDAPAIDVVITVCGSAAAETCPIWPGAPIRVHWGVEDPAAVSATDQPAAFAESYRILEYRADALLALQFENLDRAALLQELATIGEKV